MHQPFHDGSSSSGYAPSSNSTSNGYDPNNGSMSMMSQQQQYGVPPPSSSSSIMNTMKREFSEMYHTMSTSISIGNGDGYFQQPVLSIGQTYGRSFLLLFNNICFYISCTALTMICLIPLAIVFGKDNPILHPIVTLLFTIYFLLLGRMIMIHGTSDIYIGNTPNFIDIVLNKCKVYLFPLFLCTLCIGVPIIFSFEILTYITGDKMNDVQHVELNTFAFWFSLVLNILLYTIYLYISSYALLLIVPCMVIEMIENPLTALRRSYELSGNGYHMYLFYGYSVMILFYFFIEIFVEVLSGHWFRPTNMNFIDTLFWSIPTFFIVPFLSITETIMYIHIRIQKESLTHDVFSNELRTNALSISTTPGSSSGSTRRSPGGAGGARYNPVVMMTNDDGNMNPNVNMMGSSSGDVIGGGYGAPPQQQNVGEINFAYRAPANSSQQPSV